MKDKKYKWWEKTVEYQFVIDSTKNRKLTFAAPLSGKEESAGDGIFGENSRIILIEFKKSKEELDSEKDKFTDYESAESELREKDAFHFLLYGKISSERTKLETCACNYFSRREIQNPEKVFNYGTEPDTFNDYLRRIIELKKSDGRGGSSNPLDSNASVIGVSTQGVTSISLRDYIQTTMNDLYNQLTDTQDENSAPAP
jgi:hypothetical protein